MNLFSAVIQVFPRSDNTCECMYTTVSALPFAARQMRVGYHKKLTRAYKWYFVSRLARGLGAEHADNTKTWIS